MCACTIFGLDVYSATVVYTFDARCVDSFNNEAPNNRCLSCLLGEHEGLLSGKYLVWQKSK